ncbi:MAG: CinA family protein [Collinsella sp.]|nr:CinA family protein [Collinsella sp.]
MQEGSLPSLASKAIEALSHRGLTVALAESCTAGMVASTLASVPGASSALKGGAVTYCDEIKNKVLGVSSETLRIHSAVSHETAREMADGARRLFDVDVAISLTGYAGPGGGTELDPAGTIYIGVSSRLGTDSLRCSLPGDRDAVRHEATRRAIQLLIDTVMELS